MGGAATPLNAYWYGGVSSVWNDASSAPTSNWTDATGTINAQQIPGPISNVHFSGLNSNPGATTTLGADFSINSLNFDATATGLTTIGGSNTLTIGAGGINVANGSGGATLSAANLVLGDHAEPGPTIRPAP